MTDDASVKVQAPRSSSSLHLTIALYIRYFSPRISSLSNKLTMLRTSFIKSARAVAAPRYFSFAARRMAEGATGSGSSRATGSAGG
jgi:hypothetical protein